ncbi:MAG: hypothetical protein A3H70_00375 [Candidatus Komeilibacteria bacterium RIFCSPLOWO2_02_FULL_48_11]|uniref:MvaI/BcnI restriction endonuclease domain-containing protein n=1 Tax=Candidatus Komeilibacteria bacterium RIFCSPLOWO2_02_FULL_48_11 TaxID=1798553 RepID=A0A1G2BW86_9BACT|nr:MAG: hypothetical protein A3H70_00375 [Candidatus Komeilibacteria bacterium RIFCSPLOWO2_02_FULL_48_11]
MDLKILQKKLEEIKKMGFVETHRSGNTGIGKTLEDLLKIKENNIPLPDIGEVAELKSYRKSAQSMMTLFTLEPLPQGGDRDRTLLDGFDFDAFKKRVKNDDIVADLRMYYRPDGSVRNHGTGFRVKMKKLDDCFATRLRLI